MNKGLAGLAHLGILLNWLGVVLTLIIYLSQSDRSSFTARHARQALAYQVTVAILGLIGGLLLRLVTVGAAMTGAGPRVMLLGPILLGVIVAIGLLCYGIYAAIAAFSGREFRYALIGDWVDRI